MYNIERFHPYHNILNTTFSGKDDLSTNSKVFSLSQIPHDTNPPTNHQNLNSNHNLPNHRTLHRSPKSTHRILPFKNLNHGSNPMFLHQLQQVFRMFPLIPENTPNCHIISP